MTAWIIEKVGATVKSDADGRTRIAVILSSADAALMPDVGEQMRHPAGSNGLPNPGCPQPCPLSDRELECLRLLAESKTYKQIAVELGLSVSTIRTHLHNAYGTIKVADRAQAVILATRQGWL